MDNILYEIAMIKVHNLRDTLVKKIKGKVYVYYHTDCNVLEVSITTKELGCWRKLFTNVDQLEVPEIEKSVLYDYRLCIISKFLIQ